MSPLLELLAVAAALYLVECLIAVPRHALLFWSTGWGPCRVLRLVHSVGTLRRALSLGMPLPPLGVTHLAEFWPLSLSPEGVYGRPVQQLDLGAGWADPGLFVRFNDIRTVATRGTHIRINGADFVECSCPTAAELWARRIRDLAAAPGDQREALIDVAIRNGLDVEGVVGAVTGLRSASIRLRVLCNALFALMFVISPLVIWAYGLGPTWSVLLVSLMVLWVLTLLDFLRTHRKLLPTHAGQRRSLGLALGLTPVATARAAEVLGREVLVAYHPLAIAQVMCSEADHLDLAQRVYLDLVFPAQLDEATEPVDGVQTLRWLRDRIRRITERWLRDRRIDPAELLRPPAPDDAACRTYCPRCLGSHTLSEGQCAACPGVTLRTFDGGHGVARG